MRRRGRWAIGGAVLALLAGCGGGGSGGSSVSTVSGPTTATPTPTPTATATSTPTPTPSTSSSGQVAAVDVGDIPVAATDIVTDYKVTNAGLYMQVSYADTSKSDAVIKLRGTPAFSDAWYVATPNDGRGSVADYAPTNIYSETRSAVSFYWAGFSPATSVDRWGMHTVNNGGVSTIAEERHFGSYGIQLVAAGARSGVVASRPWVLWYEATTIGNNGYRIYQDDGQYTKPNSIADRFTTFATPALPGGADIMLSHPDNAELYVGAGNKLYVYSATAQLRSWTLPNTTRVSDMMWVDGTLYLAGGGKIYRLDGTTLQPVADSGAPLDVPGRFCISGGEIFLPSGDAINLRTNVKRNWLKKGTLTTSQTTSAQQLEIAVLSGAGVYCSSYASQTTLYVPSTTDHKIRVITPVAG